MKDIKKDRIVFMGMKHSGKSSLGRMTADIKKISFADLDDLLEEAAENSRDLLPPEIKRKCREIYRYSPALFRKFEYEGTEIAVSLMEDEPMILALGGGTIENQPAMDLLKQHTVLVYLAETFDILMPRILSKGVPSFLNPEDPEGSFLNIYKKRTPLYERAADIVIRLNGASLYEALEMLEDKL